MASASVVAPSGTSASKGTNSAGWLNGLGAAPAPMNTTLPPNPGGSPTPNDKQPGNDVVPTAPNKQAPAIPPEVVNSLSPQERKSYLVLRAVSAGQLPGVVIEKGITGRKDTKFTPDMIVKSGVDLYRPHDKDYQLVMFNPKKVPLSTVKVLDKKGKLGDAFPSFTDLVGEENLPKEGEEGSAGEDEDNDSAGPPGHDTPQANPLNLTAMRSDTPPPVPVLPRPTFGAGAQQRVASARLKALAGSGNPGSSPVNNLWAAPV